MAHYNIISLRKQICFCSSTSFFLVLQGVACYADSTFCSQNISYFFGEYFESAQQAMRGKRSKRTSQAVISSVLTAIGRFAAAYAALAGCLSLKTRERVHNI